MIKKQISVETILQYLGEKVITVHGQTVGLFIDNLADVDRVCETTLDWINPSKPNKQEMVEGSKARILLTDSSIVPVEGKTLIVVNNPKVALAEVGNHFFVEPIAAGIHPTAIVDSEAKIGKDVYIGPYCVIGKCTIGDGCSFDSNIRIYNGVKIGGHCSVKAGAVLGGDGFGFERDADGNLFRFPQVGSLIIGNYVEIGANSSIDRGSLADTIIGDYTKISSLCHISHNNKIGQNVVITCGTNIAGSNVIEDNVWIAPNSSIRGWVKVGEGATVGMAAVVTKNIPANETWVGNPARKLEK
jgi:UDP-3-O-[3-hydroxymyristoyl] glucosamine N-acyltransferase